MSRRNEFDAHESLVEAARKRERLQWEDSLLEVERDVGYLWIAWIAAFCVLLFTLLF